MHNICKRKKIDRKILVEDESHIFFLFKSASLLPYQGIQGTLGRFRASDKINIWAVQEF